MDDVSQSYGDRRVLTDLSVIVSRSDRLGLIGENGAGKSTLLRIIAGAEQPDSGSVSRPARTGLLWQEVQYAPSDTVGMLLEGALAHVRAIERELMDAAVAIDGSPAGDERYSVALAAAEKAEVWTVDSRRAEALAGLGVEGIPGARRLDEVSGGQRSRLALAALLLGRPEALVLDEPTNHLDDVAAEYLRSQLIRWAGPVVFASHDRAFLDEVATALLDIDPARAGNTRFGGNYTLYLEEKASERARWEAQYESEQVELEGLRIAVDVTAREINHNRPMKDKNKMAFGMQGDKVQIQISRRIRNAQGRLDELTAEQVRKPTSVLNFAGIPTGSHALSEEGMLVQLSEVRVAGRLGIDAFAVEPTTQLLVTGQNGAGKSTLLSVLAGVLAPDGGRMNRRRGLRTALLEQDVHFSDPAESPRTIYEARLGERRAEAVPLTGLGLIASRDLDRPIGALSIGQQRRLALALIIAKPPHLFLLDEPTNHLSLSLATELEEALGAYPGAVIVASHDRWLRRRWTGERLELAAGRRAGKPIASE